MDCLRIIGGRQLHGSARVGGSKNAALPILAASILAEAPVRLRGIPSLLDVETQVLVLKQLGVRSDWLPDGELELQTENLSCNRADHRLVSRMRASFCVLGPLLARRRAATVALPGGCNLGTRPVDLHLRALESLGADISISHGYVTATAKRLRGAHVCMQGTLGATVTGTANVLCAAVRAEGRTIISGAACEPEIEDLGRFLQSLGAEIDGLGTGTIVVQGRSELGGATHTVIPDRIEAGTLLLAVAAAGGSARIEGLVPQHLIAVLEALERLGVAVEVGTNYVIARSTERPRPTNITALPYPGLPTDLQAQFMAVLSLADGRSQIQDKVFPQRFMHVAELCRLGAMINHSNSTATIIGVSRLAGAAVAATDLRAGAALVIAGLAAKGVTTVTGLEHLDRGYTQLEQKLAGLGANVVRETSACSIDMGRAEMPTLSSSQDHFFDNTSSTIQSPPKSTSLDS